MKYKLKAKFEGLKVVSLGGVEWLKEGPNFVADIDEATVESITTGYDNAIEKVRVRKSK